MMFAYLENFHKNWNDILVIGKTIEHDNKKYHITGMTLADEAKLLIYITATSIWAGNGCKCGAVGAVL